MISEMDFDQLDKDFRSTDRTHIRRTRNIQLIPDFKNRRGGKLSYAEWAHVVGIFQTIFYQELEKKTGNEILDIGCGTGLLGIAAEPYTTNGGRYVGLDIMKYDINFCRNHYTQSNYHFIHMDVANPTYAKNQNILLSNWPINNESFDLVTALSVWTHLNEEHAIFYFREIYRVLKTSARAIITFFYLNEDYDKSLKQRSDQEGRYHTSNQNMWIFDTKAYNSNYWYCPHRVKNPEDAIGVRKEGLEQLLNESGLKLIRYYPGNWKEIPGLFFQDILIFEK